MIPVTRLLAPFPSMIPASLPGQESKTIASAARVVERELQRTSSTRALYVLYPAKNK